MKITVGDWSTDVDGFEGLINKTLNVEAMAMERATGETFENLCTLMQQGSRTALTAFVWVLKKREHPTLTFDDVTFEEGDLSITVSDEELAAARAAKAAAEAEAANPHGADEAPQTDAPPASDSETTT